jgi:microtubule-associated protein-like 6
MNISEQPRTQTFFDQHTDDIISMAWNEDKSEMFTSEMGAKPVIYRWSKDGTMIKSYKGAKKGVSALAVNSTYVVGSGLDDDHYLYVFDIEKGGLVAS